MKFQNVGAFQKHLPDHPAPVYIIASPSDVERQKLISALVKALGKGDATRCQDLDEALREIQAPDLFGGGNVVICDGLSRSRKDLEAYCQQPIPSATLILGCSSFKSLSSIYTKAKKEVVALDLSAEKPWERKDRLMQWVARRAQREGKRLHPGALALLFEWLGTDLALLEQEVEKLFCYIGERPEITEADVKTICAQTEQATGWQLAESCVWGVKGEMQQEVADLSLLLPLISSLRYHLQVGLQIASGISDIPRLRPKTLERYRRVASAKGLSFFSNGLDALFDLELAAKSTSTPPKALFERFYATLAS